MSGLAPVKQLWRRASKREQRLLMLAAAVLGLGLLWWVGVAPAWRALRAAPAQHLALDAQLRQMQQLQAQVKDLRALTILSADEARLALEQSLKPLGKNAQMLVQVERVTVTITDLAPDALAQFLAAARQNAHLTPKEAHLKRNAQGGWDGTLVLQLPST